MALQRFEKIFLIALMLGCISTAGVNSAELNSTNFASTTEVTTMAELIQTETQSKVSLAPKLSLSETLVTKGNLTEARITSITFRSEEADVDEENDENISFGIRSFTVEVATPATQTENPIPLNENVGAASIINVQKAAASSLPILTMENDLSRNDKVSNERNKVFDITTDTVSPKSTGHAENEQENVASTVTTPIDMSKNSANSSKNDDSSKFVELKLATTIAPVKLTQLGGQSSIGVIGNNSKNGREHEQLSISSNGMHVEQKLENGLYRIKIAEITTDEFNNGKTKQEPNKILSNEQKTNKSDNFKHPLPIAASHSSGQINIADLYPSKLEDFSSIIRESNQKLIEEKNRYVGVEKSGSNQPITSDARFSIIDDTNEQENSIQFGNDVDANVDDQKQSKINGASNAIENNIPTTKIEIELIDEPTDTSKDDVKNIGNNNDEDYVSPAERENGPNGDKVTDFTSELQLKDDMVSKIERSFREISTTNIQNEQQEQQERQQLQQRQQQQQQPSINHAINWFGFIERRAKKFDPMFRKRLMPFDESVSRESQQPSTHEKSIDENIILQSDKERNLNANNSNVKLYRTKDGKSSGTTVNPNQPDGNKYTNNDANSSKSQMVDKNNKANDLIEHELSGAHGSSTAKKDLILSSLKPINSTERKILFINMNSGIGSSNSGNNTIDKNELERLQRDQEQIIKERHLNASTNIDVNVPSSTNMHLYIMHNDAIGPKPTESIKTNYSDANEELLITSTSTSRPTASETIASSLLLEAHPSEFVVTPKQPTSKEPSASPASIDAISSTESNFEQYSSSPTSMQTKSRAMLYPPNPSFGRRGFDGFYFETDCDMQTPLSTDSTIWRGNETHELNLPTTVSQFLSSLLLL